MKLTEKHILKSNQDLVELCTKCKNLYNQVLYYWRQAYFGEIERFTEYEIQKLFCEYNEKNYRALPSNTSQQIIKQVFQDINSYFGLLKLYKSGGIKLKPKLPNYKKSLSVCHFTSSQVQVRRGIIKFPKLSNLKPLTTKVSKLKHVRIIPKANHFIAEIVYEIPDTPLKEFTGNWMGVDLGVNNLATCISNDDCFIVNGKDLKSINRFFHKKKAKFQSLLPKQTFTSKRINKLCEKKTNKVNDYLHKASFTIISRALLSGVERIIIGHNQNWKQKSKLGKRNNQHFQSIPHSRFIDILSYKAKKVGIDTVVTCESYTSKCSALDLEPVKKQAVYLGKRVKRGLFKSAKGVLLNADVNGALNIARLNVSDEFLNESVWSCALQPEKLNLSNN